MADSQYADIPELAAQEEAIKRRQAIAQAMMAQGLAPIEPGIEARTRTPVPVQWSQGLQKLAEAYFGKKDAEKAAKEFTGLATKKSEGEAAAVADYQRTRGGVVADPGMSLPYAKPGGGTEQIGTETLMAQPADPRKAITDLLASPYAPQGVKALALQENAPYTLGQGDTRIQSGQVIGQGTSSPLKAEQPLDELAKLNADFKAGRITPQDFQERRAIMTAPKNEPRQRTQLIQTVDPETKDPIWKLVDSDTGKTINPNVGAVKEGGVAGGGGREGVMFNRVLMSASQVTKTAENLMKIGAGASAGLGRQNTGSLFSSAKSALVNEMRPQDIQSYNVMVAGATRGLAAIESAGLMPSGTLVHQMEAVIAQPGDTELTKLRKMAEIRQIMEEGINTYLSNPRIDTTQKAKISELIGRMEKAIPFSQDDITALEQSENPQDSINDVMKRRGLGGNNAPAAYSDAEKEKRYQIWKAAHPGG